jgi:G3E family GTPase
MSVKLIIIGGFLGSGKSTAISRLARSLVRRGNRVAIVAEPPPYSLFGDSLCHDSLLVEEIPGGPILCNLDFFEESIRNLSKRKWPDIIIAAPMGSCEDLIAAIVPPLFRMYQSGIKFGPLSVMVDPFNMLHNLGLAPGREFAPEIECIIKKQMLEAEKILINKCDVFPPKDRKRIATAIAKQFPRATVHCVSARTGRGCLQWFQSILKDISNREQIMPLHNSSGSKPSGLPGRFEGLFSLSGLKEKALHPEVILKRFAEATRSVLCQGGMEISHLRAILGPVNGWHLGNHRQSMLLAPKNQNGNAAIKDYYVVRMSGSQAPIIVRGYKNEGLKQAHLTINLEGLGKPEIASEALSKAAKELTDLALFTFEESRFTGPTKISPQSDRAPFGRVAKRQ